jgi:mannose-6-phosphate isomerase-like protein (cupin superfamily)
MDAALFIELPAQPSDTSGDPVYCEFLHVSAISAGWYVLSAGQTDSQKPHLQDELYYVIRGRGRMRAGREERPVGAGTAIFVPAGMEHKFYAVDQDLTVLVCFAPAEQVLERNPR